MATQGDYSAVANALVAYAKSEIEQLPGFEQSLIPMQKLPAAAGAAAKVAVDTLDAYRAKVKKASRFMISPKASMWINLIIALLGALVGAGAELTPIFGSGVTSQILAFAGLAMTVLGAINTALHGVSAPTAGPVAKALNLAP